MQITIFSLLMSVICSSIVVVFNYLCRKKQFFIRQIGITNILFLYLASVLRMVIPYKFSFTRVIPPSGALNYFYKESSAGKTGAAQISSVAVLAAVWLTVSVALLIRFILRYRKALKEVESYVVCEDEQCRRVYNRVLNKSRRELSVTVRRSSHVVIPMGVGIFRKSIILPEETYSDSELYYILRHEYTHFQNRDLIIKIFIHIYGCVFWWNPVVYLLKRDLSQILEIKCDLDVTDKLGSRDRAEYLTTIVRMLKNAEAKRQEKLFCGATAFVTRNSQSEVVERFRIVSAGNICKRKGKVFSGVCFLVFGLFLFLSYSFVIQPDYEAAENHGTMGEDASKTGADNAYHIKHSDDTYYVYFNE